MSFSSTRTPSGGRRLSGRFSRTGTQVYAHADGSQTVEYRPPEEVGAPGSLASFRGAPVVVGHDGGEVTPANFRELVVGTVLDATFDGTHVVGTVDVGDAATIEQIDSGELVEFSCQYTADAEDEPGVSPDGEAYDAIQRNIRLNAVALGPRDWGRCGPTCAICPSEAA